MDDLLVMDYINPASLHVSEEDRISTIIELMKKYSTERIAVISKEKHIIGTISREYLRQLMKTYSDLSVIKDIKVRDIMQRHESTMVFYPRMNIMDAYNTMKCFNINYVPVADVPWEKRIIGFLCLDDILPIIRKNNLKVSF